MLRCAGHWTKLSALSAIAVSPKRQHLALYARFHPDKNLGSADTAAFLRQLARHRRGHVIVLWDGGHQHKGEPVGAFRRRHPCWILHRFPGYAPERNPDEFVWNLLKRAVANSNPQDLAHLKRLIHGPLMRLRQSQKLLWSCIYASDLPWT